MWDQDTPKHACLLNGWAPLVNSLTEPAARKPKHCSTPHASSDQAHEALKARREELPPPLLLCQHWVRCWLAPSKRGPRRRREQLLLLLVVQAAVCCQLPGELVPEAEAHVTDFVVRVGTDIKKGLHRWQHLRHGHQHQQ